MAHASNAGDKMRRTLLLAHFDGSHHMKNKIEFSTTTSGRTSFQSGNCKGRNTDARNKTNKIQSKKQKE